MKPTLGLIGGLEDEARYLLSFHFTLRSVTLGEPAADACDVLLIAQDRDAAESASMLRAMSDTPIVVIASDDAGTRIRLLECGADDVMSPACSAAEVLARLRAVHRRATRTKRTIMRIGPIVVDLMRCEVRREGRLINLSLLEYRVLVALAEESGRFVGPLELRQRVWGSAESPDVGSLYVVMSSLRARLDEGFATSAVRTRRRRGYALAADG